MSGLRRSQQMMKMASKHSAMAFFQTPRREDATTQITSGRGAVESFFSNHEE